MQQGGFRAGGIRPECSGRCGSTRHGRTAAYLVLSQGGAPKGQLVVTPGVGQAGAAAIGQWFLSGSAGGQSGIEVSLQVRTGAQAPEPVQRVIRSAMS